MGNNRQLRATQCVFSRHQRVIPNPDTRTFAKMWGDPGHQSTLPAVAAGYALRCLHLPDQFYMGTRASQNSYLQEYFIHYIGFMTIDTLIARRVRDLRKQRGYALETLSEASGVSRSMISLIERGESSPTAAVLNKLADALGVSLAALFAEEARGASVRPLSRLADQTFWKDPASGYVRRHVSPSGFASPIELVEVIFPPHETVTFETLVRNVVTHQQVWLLEGEMTVTVDAETWHLRAGDCLAMVLGQRIIFENLTDKAARYAVVLATIPNNSRKS